MNKGWEMGEQGELSELYYNTTNSEGEELSRYKRLVRAQDLRVLAHFRRAGGRYSPSQVHAAVMPEAPLTSCRRAMTNLTGEGFLTKTGTQVIGPYGRPEYLWELRRTLPASDHEEVPY